MAFPLRLPSELTMLLVKSISAWQGLAGAESIIKIILFIVSLRKNLKDCLTVDSFDCLERQLTVDMEIDVAVDAAIGPNQLVPTSPVSNGETCKELEPAIVPKSSAIPSSIA